MVTNGWIDIDLEVVLILVNIFMSNRTKSMEFIHVDHLDLVDLYI